MIKVYAAKTKQDYATTSRNVQGWKKVNDVRLNLNETIKVKLTDLGKDIYYHQYDRINAFAGREVCKPSYPKVDDDGYTEFQLRCFIELYGEHMGMACKNVICPNEIIFDAPTIDPVQKGKWIYGESEFGNDGYYCSVCGNFVPWKYGEYDIDFIKEFLFCNKCGCRMEEDKNAMNDDKFQAHILTEI